ncbi:Small nuclear ribonucleoprotein G [Manis javanica]|nr:Small nuclear ribonucleoprotein G [Manis javanica]
MDKKLLPKLNGGRHVQGILWRFNPFMNPETDECGGWKLSGQQNNTEWGDYHETLSSC